MKEYFKFKTFIITLTIFTLSILISSVLVFLNFKNEGKIVRAGTGDNITGFAWSENIGWISFNSTDCDIDGNGIFDDAAAPAGCPTSGTANDYGAVINLTTGNFSGYGWSENVGWISFQENTAPPDAYGFNANCPGTCDGSTNCTACYDSTSGNIYGWAKILSLSDDGWIKMSDDGIAVWNGAGVNINSNTNDFSGLAWNSNGICVGGTNDLADCDVDADCPSGTCEYKTGIGWVSFNCNDSQTCSGGTDDGKACDGSNCADGLCVDTCTISDYKVHAAIPPSDPTMGLIEDLACVGTQIFVRVNWTDNSTNEIGFEVQSSEDQLAWSYHCGLSYLLTDTESLETAAARSCTGLLNENTLYYFRVKALSNDGGNYDSNWAPNDNGSPPHTTVFCPPVLTYDTTTANCDSIDLSWTFGDNSNVVEYEVWRDVDNSGVFSKIAATTASTTAPWINPYTDNDIGSDVNYDYEVVAKPQNSTSSPINNIKPCPSLPTWIEVKP